MPITGNHDAPGIGGPGEPIEYAVRMRAFPQDALCDRMARRGTLTAAHVEALAAAVADLHGRAGIAGPETRFGDPVEIAGAARQNFAQLAMFHGAAAEIGRTNGLAAWTERELNRLERCFAERRTAGRVRECHGDLHLGNVALIRGQPLIFDAIEFNAGFRWTDVISDVAFLYMDLLDHGLDAFAARFLNAWLDATGDYEGLALLRFYAVYRAVVRAKVAALRAHQPETIVADRDAALAQFRDYLRLAERLTGPAKVWLAITAGLSGSGKSTTALAIGERLGAIRLRSDVERKRLRGLGPEARTGSAPGEGIYSAASNRATYRRLAELAGTVLTAGYPVIVDATFARRADRADFARLAQQARIPFAIVACTAPAALLRERLQRRQPHTREPSEATPDVLAWQMERFDALDAGEEPRSVRFDTDGNGPRQAAAVTALAALLAAPPPA
jgi:hypothetical protein